MTHLSVRRRPGGSRAAPGGYPLRADEADRVAATVGLLRERSATTDDAGTVDAARVLSGLLPEGLLLALEDFRRFGNNTGVLTVRGLPVPAALPPTPCVPDSVAVDCSPTAAILLLVLSRLGDPISYPEEKRGALIHDICPVAGEEQQQQNTGAVYFELHTENAFHAGRPDFLGLLCLRPDHDLRARSITSSIRSAITHLDAGQVEVLREPRFRTRLAPSFCRDREHRPYLAPAAVITGTAQYPLLSVDFDDTTAGDEPARAALDALHRALQRECQQTDLYPGDLIIIDNSTTVHGRAAFTPRYDGRDRWLQRMFVVRSLRDVLPMLDSAEIYKCRPLSI